MKIITQVSLKQKISILNFRHDLIYFKNLVKLKSFPSKFALFRSLFDILVPKRNKLFFSLELKCK